MKEQPQIHPNAIPFERTENPMSDGACLVKRLPIRRVPALVRRGMVVMNGGRYAQVVACTAELCVIRYEDGSVEALYWPEVSLDHCRPSPKELRGRRG